MDDNAYNAINKLMHPNDWRAFQQGKVKRSDVARLKKMYRKAIGGALDDSFTADDLADAVDEGLDEMYQAQAHKPDEVDPLFAPLYAEVKHKSIWANS